MNNENNEAIRHIGSVTLDLSRYDAAKDIYSDGPIEDDMLAIARDGRSRIDAALAGDGRWPILYHFSPERQNILSWYPFPDDAAILEIGTGCGAVTGALFGARHRVTGIESSLRRAEIAAYRHQEHALALHVGTFSDIADSLGTYDIITLIGVLEYAGLFAPGSDPAAGFLAAVRAHLAPRGRILLAIENRPGPPPRHGMPEDHTGRPYDGLLGYPRGGSVRTYSRPALERLLRRAGFRELHWYTPYPDYKFCRQVFPEDDPPTPERLFADLQPCDRPATIAFDERQVAATLAEDGCFSLFADSFFVEVMA